MIPNVSIQEVTIGQKQAEKMKLIPGPWDKDSILGQPLRIVTNPGSKHANIYYKTTKKSAALTDWLKQIKLKERNTPVSIYSRRTYSCRTWIPLQDTPGNRFTYTAEVSVQDNLIAVMSAKKISNKNGNFKFRMNNPSYLVALAVGDLKYKKLMTCVAFMLKN